MSALRARQAARRVQVPQIEQGIAQMNLQEPIQEPIQAPTPLMRYQINDNSEDTSEIEVYEDNQDYDNYNTDGGYHLEGDDDQSELHLMKNPMNFDKKRLDLSVKQLDNYFDIEELDQTIFDELIEVPKSDRIYIAAFLFYYHYKNEINQMLSSERLPMTDGDLYLERYINFLIVKEYFKLQFTNASTLLTNQERQDNNDLFTRISLIFNRIQRDNPLKNMVYTPPQRTLAEEFYTLQKPLQLTYYNTLTQKSMLDILDIINNYTDIEFAKAFTNGNCDQKIDISILNQKELFIEENMVKKLPNILRNIMKIKYRTTRFTLDQLKTIIAENPNIESFIQKFNTCLTDYNRFTKPNSPLVFFGPKNRPTPVKRQETSLFIPKKKSRN
jgi:hypothetical protein